jgi:hypothetical protein
MPLDTTKAPPSASPLWIIALFIALSEATAGAASITTNGSTRLIFACFAVVFPTLVFAVFIWLLVKHAPKLYAPGQYSKEITPEIYRIGISRADSIVLGRAVAETVVPLLGGESGTETREAVVKKVARRFETLIEESSIIVSLDQLKRRADPLQIPVGPETSVQWLLDTIFFALDPAVEPNTYGRAWMLIDDDGNQYAEMGRSWARDHLKRDKDPRTIDEVGILPGSHLTAILKGRSRLAGSFRN